jgi:hypothetical protein
MKICRFRSGNDAVHIGLVTDDLTVRVLSPAGITPLQPLLESDDHIDWIRDHLELEWLTHPAVRFIVTSRLAGNVVHFKPAIPYLMRIIGGADHDNPIIFAGRNIFVVGDEDQCIPAGSLVRTPQGETPIERIAVGDRVVCGAGRGTTAQGTVEKTRSRPYQGKIVRITLQSGCTLQATPNHMCFARLGPHLDVYYVYLMYRRDKGYRIGLTRGYRSEGRRYGVVNGLDVRVRQEHADKAWILRVCSDRAEAAFYEQFFASDQDKDWTIAEVRAIQTKDEGVHHLRRRVSDHLDPVRLAKADADWGERN